MERHNSTASSENAAQSRCALVQSVEHNGSRLTIISHTDGDAESVEITGPYPILDLSLAVECGHEMVLPR